MRLAAALLLAAAWSVAWSAPPELPPVDDARWSRDFDGHFRKYAKRYFGPHFEWRWFKAQGIAESRLNPDARSPAGARGVMQVLPSTFAEIQEEEPHFLDLESPRFNIAAGIYYDWLLFRKWRGGLADRERLYLAFASYNAGYGRILRAFRRADPPVASWRQVSHHSPGETRAYVATIARLMEESPRERPRGVARWLSEGE